MLTIIAAFLIAIMACYATALSSFGSPKAKHFISSILNVTGRSHASPKPASNGVATNDRPKKRALQDGSKQGEKAPEMAVHKDMYYKLHNLEKYPEVLPHARNQLISLFAEVLDKASKGQQKASILKLDSYSRDRLTEFLRDQDGKVNQQWEDYNIRRKQGGPMELFKDKTEAIWWLKQIAPVKYVDGAWLGYINRITLPFHLRPVVKNSWQVLSEELGDGDLDKNHTYVYRRLTDGVGLDLPPGDSKDFIHSRHGLDEPNVWKAALAQLLISLIPHEFFPEILGFNMHFEALTLETLQASREVKELGLDSYYFMLHVSIDNADSGHTAIAQQAVCDYVEQVNQTEGEAAARQAWRRVQVGYLLSAGIPSRATCPSMRRPAVDSFPQTELEGEIVKIFQAKALVGHKIHSHSEVKIGGKKLVDWLDPSGLASKQWQMEFLDKFSQSKAWVNKGNSNKSRFVKELSWGGRMFGAFTQAETDTVREWIDRMPNPHPQQYWDFTGRADKDLTSPVNSRLELPFDRSNSQALKRHQSLWNASSSPKLLKKPFALKAGVNVPPDPTRFLPLWFAHPCLLETFVSVPWKTTSPFDCSVVKTLRAQAGFNSESGVVAGMDEVNKTESLGLIEFGQEMLRTMGLPEMASLKDVLGKWHSEPAITMILLSARPRANKGLLIGMAMAFASLHWEIACSDLISPRSKATLSDITSRETASLEECMKELNYTELEDCSKGHRWASGKIEACFEHSQGYVETSLSKA